MIGQETYGQKMKRLRQELGWSQSKLAMELGVTAPAVAAWEQGKRSGVSPEAAALPRRAIELLMRRLRNRRRGSG